MIVVSTDDYNFVRILTFNFAKDVAHVKALVSTLLQFADRVRMNFPTLSSYLAFSMASFEWLYISVFEQWLQAHLFQTGNDIVSCDTSAFPTCFAAFQFIGSQKVNVSFCGCKIDTCYSLLFRSNLNFFRGCCIQIKCCQSKQSSQKQMSLHSLCSN